MRIKIRCVKNRALLFGKIFTFLEKINYQLKNTLMKHRLSLGMLSFLALLFLVFSCRNDYLLEHQHQEEIRQNGLTSKIISLSESKHKEKLWNEIKESKSLLNKSFKNQSIFGKNISYGDSITINTDHVIYIENGPNYHTYTFKIERTNALPDAPLENLLLSPLPDGSYKEFLVTYQLSAQEKSQLLNGNPVDTDGKTTIVELSQGTFNGNGQLAKTTMVCGWEGTTYWEKCSEDKHGASNFWECQFQGDFVDNAGNPGTPPYAYTIYTYTCEEVEETLLPSEGGSGSSGSGSSGGGNPENPLSDCTGAASDPNEVGIVDENGCDIGVPTRPNTGAGNDENTDRCNAIKKATDDAKYKQFVPVLKTKYDLDHEVGYRLSHPVPGTSQTGTQVQLMENYPNTNRLNFNATNYTFAFIHSHHNQLYPIFSPDDLVALNIWIKGVLDYNNNPNNNPKININELSISVVTPYGVYLISFDGTNVDSYPNYTIDQWDKLIDDYKKFMDRAGSVYDSDYMEKLEKQFLKFVDKHMPMPGLRMYKVEDQTNTEIYLENGNRKTRTCP